MGGNKPTMLTLICLQYVSHLCRYVISDLTALLKTYLNGTMVHAVAIAMGFVMASFFHGFSIQLVLWTTVNFMMYMLRKVSNL